MNSLPRWTDLVRASQDSAAQDPRLGASEYTAGELFLTAADPAGLSPEQIADIAEYLAQINRSQHSPSSTLGDLPAVESNARRSDHAGLPRAWGGWRFFVAASVVLGFIGISAGGIAIVQVAVKREVAQEFARQHAQRPLPAGPPDDFLVSRIEALRAQNLSNDALTILDRISMDGLARARELYVARGELRLSANRCPAAMEDFRESLAGGQDTGILAERALRGIASCRAQAMPKPLPSSRASGAPAHD